MADFEERQSEKVDEPDDGWTKVGKKKTVRLTEADQVEMRARAAKKRKKGELVSFVLDSKYQKCYAFSRIKCTLSVLCKHVVFLSLLGNT